jgi:hypothetical protein
MEKIIVGIISVVVLASSLHALELPMLQSKEMLQTYAVEQSAKVYAAAGTSLPAGDKAQSGYVPVETSTLVGIIRAIGNCKLSIDVANPKDPVYSSVWVSNKEYQTLFWGNNHFNLVEGKTGYTLPINYGRIELEMVEKPPIKIPGAVAARLFTLSNGQTVYLDEPLRVENGNVFFPSRLAGSSTLLQVEVSNGKTSEFFYWNVASGASVSKQTFNIGLFSSIKGMSVTTDYNNGLPGVNNVMLQIPTTNQMGFNKTLEHYAAGGNNPFFVSLWTSEGKWFTGVKIRLANTTEWITHNAVYQKSANMHDAMMVVHLNSLPAGIYYIIPLWNDGDLVEPVDPNYPTDGNGKG